jgi:outer membrane protein assembly factor BamB
MKSIPSMVLACVFAVSPARAAAQDSVRFSDIAGWWSAHPAHGGESSHVALQFLEKDGKPEARLWLMAIGAYDIPLGAVSIHGNSIDTKEPFPLVWNPVTRSLSGHLPSAAAPVYEIPIEFERSDPLVRPPPREWKAPAPRLLWSVETGAPVWAGIERAGNGVLFVGNEQGDLHAMGAEGKVLWKRTLSKPIRAQPTAIAAHVYVSADTGYLHKLRRDTGEEVWRARIDSGSEPRIPSDQEKSRWDRYGSSVVSDGRRLFVASRDKNLYALDLKTGGEVWRVAAGDIMTSTPALHRDQVIFAAYDGKIRAVAARDGEARWTYDAKLAVPGDLTVAADRVLAGSRSYDLIALDANSGKELWKRYYWFSWIESPPVVRDGVIYTGSSDATHVYAINLADGSLRWKSAVPGYSWQRTAVTNGLVVAGTLGRGAYPASRNGSLVALDRATGAIRWLYLEPPSEATVKARESWGFASSPVIGDGVVYAADFNGRVHAFVLE